MMDDEAIVYIIIVVLALAFTYFGFPIGLNSNNLTAFGSVFYAFDNNTSIYWYIWIPFVLNLVITLMLVCIAIILFYFIGGMMEP